MENGSPSPQQSKQTKRCFVVSEFGSDEKTRLERTQVLKHLVRKILEPMGYEVRRADDIDDLGQITHQIIERLLDDDLVVADLTGLNPNVFYELAVRHAAKKPVITLMTEGHGIPFDVKDVRTVFYDLHDPDKLEAAQADFRQKVKAMEANPGDVRNPITAARNVTLLQQSDDPQLQTAGQVLSALNDLRDEVRGLIGRHADYLPDHAAANPRPLWGGARGRPGGIIGRATLAALEASPYSVGEPELHERVEESVAVPPAMFRNVLLAMAEEGAIHQPVDGFWAAGPS
jgi:hypothetical protein